MAESPSVLQFCRKAADRILSPVLRWHGAQPAQFAKYGNTLGPLVNRRYQSYADMCHSQSGEQRDETGVRSAGSVLIRNVMPTDDALQLSAKVDACVRSQDPRAAVAESTAQVMRSIRNPITTLGRSVVEIFAHPDVNQQIRAYFGSHFRIQWLDCYRSLPTTEVSHSWLWHSDNVPTETLKVMLHLTDAGPDQGATLFMSFDDTQEYFRAGYRGDTSQRVADLQDFATTHNLPFRPFSHHAKAGDVMLFNNNALHRAVPPRSGYRDVLTYLILPNPIPWDQQLALDGISAIESCPGGYPRDPHRKQAA